jgi:hypothetical protein
MTGLNHAVTGALVAVAIDKPILALPAAFLSHFAADFILHWDYKLKPVYRELVIIMDLTLSLSLLLVLSIIFDDSKRLIIAGGLLGILPDAMWLPHIIRGEQSPMNGKSILHKVRLFHHKIQHELAIGAVVEAVWFIAAVVLIFQVGE